MVFAVVVFLVNEGRNCCRIAVTAAIWSEITALVPAICLVVTESGENWSRFYVQMAQMSLNLQKICRVHKQK